MDGPKAEIDIELVRATANRHHRDTGWEAELPSALHLLSALARHPHVDGLQVRQHLDDALAWADWLAQRESYQRRGYSPIERLPFETIERIVRLLVIPVQSVPERWRAWVCD
jgi:hypothetical protein